MAELARWPHRGVARVAVAIPVEVYRRVDGALLVHACPGDRRAVPGDARPVGCATLDAVRWSRRLGCPLAQAKGAVVPRVHAAELIAELQVIG